MNVEPAGCYGKLPLHGDFIRHNVDTQALGPLLRWLEESVARAKRSKGTEWGGAMAAGETTRFLWHDGDLRRAAAGVMVAGRDRAGRRWPFLVLRPIRGLVEPSAVSSLPVCFAGFFAAADRLIGLATRTLGDLQILRSQVDGLRSAPIRDVAELTAEERVRDLGAAAVWGHRTGEDAVDRRCLLLQNAADSFAGRGVPRYVLRAAADTSAEVGFLLELCGRLSAGSVPTLVLWNEAHGGAPAGVAPSRELACRLLYDRLGARFYPPLFFENEPSDVAFDLTNDGFGDTRRMTEVRARFGDLLSRPGLSVGEVLDAVG